MSAATSNPLTSTVELQFSDIWRTAYPGAAIGILEMSPVQNSPPGPELFARLVALEAEIRARHEGRSRRDLENLPALQPYLEHYRRFGKTYHIFLQLESVAFRGRPMAGHEALVSAMFAAEIDKLLLTAGHDLEALQPPLLAEVTRAGEQYIGIGGNAIEVKPGDMSIRDGNGIISTVLYGPDRRTRLGPNTRSVLFTTYAPEGIAQAEIEDHLREIESLVMTQSPRARTEWIAVRQALRAG